MSICQPIYLFIYIYTYIYPSIYLYLSIYISFYILNIQGNHDKIHNLYKLLSYIIFFDLFAHLHDVCLIIKNIFYVLVFF